MATGERPFGDTARAASGWLTPFGLGAFALGTAIAVPVVGPAGLLALLVPLGMVGYSALLAESATEEIRSGSGGVARKNVELRETNAQLREQVVELHATAVNGARQHAHENERSYQSTVRAFIETMHREGDAARG
ncbi:MAG TPA: hypothetical protein VG370_24015 [Chloroflexota bacterium]|nr:hypothetical protein [Chloroflexota bacterium]